MRTTNIFLALAIASAAYAQVAQPEKADGPKVKVVDQQIKSIGEVDPDSVATFKDARLSDLDGKPVTIDLGEKITIVEYWSRSSRETSLYWNRMRELEHQFKDSKDIQFISVNYDFALGGKKHQDAVKKFLNSVSKPETVYLDIDDGIRDIFSLPGTMCYMMFNESGQYVFRGRGDAPETEELFEKLIPTQLQRKKGIEQLREKYKNLAGQ